MQITVFYDATPCSLVDHYQYFEGTSFETLVTIYQTTRHHITKYSNLRGHHCENFIYHLIMMGQIMSVGEQLHLKSRGTYSNH
jgi:hypothetical protein